MIQSYHSPVHRSVLLLALCLALLGLAGCAAGVESDPTPVSQEVSSNPQTLPSATATIGAPTATPLPTATSAPTLTPTAKAEPTATSTPTPWPYVVVIDPGHGGRDLGARRFNDGGRMEYHESTVTLEASLLLRDELESRGFTVVMTREGDYEVAPELRDGGNPSAGDFTLVESQARVDLANAAGGDLLLSIHMNAFEYPDGRRGLDVGGIQTYYCAERSFGDDNHRFAVLIHQTMIEAFLDFDYELQDRGVLEDSYLAAPGSERRHLILLGPESPRIVRPSQMPGVLSEPLFITHEVEGEMARDPVVLTRLAVAYADAIEAFFLGVDPRE